MYLRIHGNQDEDGGCDDAEDSGDTAVSEQTQVTHSNKI